MEYDLFKEWLPSITEKSGYLFDGRNDQETEQKYPAFMINRALSQYEDTALIANEVNRHSSLDPKLQYDFYFHLVAKRKRFSKWAKANKTEEVKTIMEAYNISAKKAEEIQTMFSSEEMEQLRQYLYKGGKK